MIENPHAIRASRKTNRLICSLVALGLTANALRAADQYWDLNGAIAGSGSATPSGTWDSATANWNPDALGTRPVTTWGSGNRAAFSAGSDATGGFTVAVTGTLGASGILLEEGTLQLTSGIVSISAGAVTLNPGSTLVLDSGTRITAAAGSSLTLNGSTIRQTGPSGPFISGLGSISVGASGGTIDISTAGGTSTNAATITGVGNILTKTGAGEFRHQGNMTNTTIAKLIVNQGLYRLGTGGPAGTQSERGFGAVPLAFTPDAITLSGGGQIGVSFAATLHANRGITLGAGGGGFNMSGAAMTVPGAISGSGPLTVTGGTQPLTLLGVNSFTGGFTMNGGGNVNVGSTGRLAGVGPVTITSGTLSLSNAATTVTSLSGAGGLTFRNGHLLTISNSSPMVFSGVIAGSGGLVKNGAGILTLDGGSANTFSGPVTINEGEIVAGKANALGSGNNLILAGGSLDTGGFNLTMGTLDLNAVATIDFGAGSSRLIFANSSALDWGGFVLHVTGWTLDNDWLQFVGGSSSLTPAQVSQIFFDDLAEGAKIDNAGLVLPVSVPEPSSTALCLLAGLGLALLIRRNRRE